jgi:hypothetical protein
MKKLNNIVHDIKQKRGYNKIVYDIIIDIWGGSPMPNSPLVGYLKYNNHYTDEIDLVELSAHIEQKIDIIFDDIRLFQLKTVRDICHEIIKLQKD